VLGWLAPGSAGRAVDVLGWLAPGSAGRAVDVLGMPLGSQSRL